MQIVSVLWLCLSNFQTQHLEIATTQEAKCTCTSQSFCYHQKSFNRKEMVITVVTFKMQEKFEGMTKIMPQKLILDLVEKGLNV